MRKRFGSASEETILKVGDTKIMVTLEVCNLLSLKQVNGDGLSLALSNGDLDTLKAEIVREMRLEIQKVKNEIIDGRLYSIGIGKFSIDTDFPTILAAIKSEFNRR